MTVASSFTPLASLAGGALIGLAAAMLMLFQGRIAGISGIVSRLLLPAGDGQSWGRLAFVAGLVLAPLVHLGLTGTAQRPEIATGPFLLAVAGGLVGFGAVWGNGCTSGHGICGLSRLSLRSAVAVATFMTTAIATVFLIRHVL